MTLPVRRQQDPIRAWKRAEVEVGGGGLCFVGVGMLGAYTAEDWASCLRSDDPRKGPHERVPDPDCTCGFYALAERWSVDLQPGGHATLDVELYGRVIRHGDRYRAERQRVLLVAFDFCCRKAVDGCSEDPVGVVVDAGGRLVPICGPHAEGVLVPRPLVDVADLLGTEVRWGDRPLRVSRHCAGCNKLVGHFRPVERTPWSPFCCAECARAARQRGVPIPGG